MQKTKLSEKYQIVIPKDVRQKMKLSVGMHVSIYPIDDDTAVIVRHPTSYVKALRGLGKDVWRKLGGVDYIKHERSLWDK